LLSASKIRRFFSNHQVTAFIAGRKGVMILLFTLCAALGGTILVLQFLLSLVGLSGHADFSGDVAHDFGGDFHDGGGDVHAEATHDSHSSDDSDHHDANWLFRVLSFRAVVAALAFFGLAGLAADSADVPLPVTLLIAIAAGMAAMYGVYWMMRGMQSLQAEGTARIERAIGKIGTVYLRIPANESESGKIQINLQNRTMEYLAMTSGPELPTGTKVEVVGVISPTTVAVLPVTGPERN
jgi:membrane protein implicated in regulation of membrane protease activity